MSYLINTYFKLYAYIKLSCIMFICAFYQLYLRKVTSTETEFCKCIHESLRKSQKQVIMRKIILNLIIFIKKFLRRKNN